MNTDFNAAIREIGGVVIALPYLRVVRPALPGQRHAASGNVMRQYVPQPAHMSLKYLDAPWKKPAEMRRQSGCIIGGD